MALARRTRSACGLVALTMASTASAQAIDWLWVDGFEDDTPRAFRFDDLDLRDPHVFTLIGTPPLALCFDFTDNPIPVANFSFNGAIQGAYTGDTNPADGFLDASNLLLFRPLRQDGQPARVDAQAGQCTAPVAGTQCAPAPASTPSTYFYASQTTGTCLGAISGTLGTPAYNPPLATADAPCFRSSARTLVLDSGGVQIPLVDAQIGAALDAVPAAVLSNGVLRGFLRESDANGVLLPNPVAGQPPIPLSSLLPGGTGNCSTRNDKDNHNGETGWWFYLNFRASSVPYSGL
jgi:hypothetical protein